MIYARAHTHTYTEKQTNAYTHRGILCGVMANVLDYDIKVCEIEVKSRSYIYFRTYTLGKVIKPLIATVMSQITSLLFLYEDGLVIK